MGHADRSHPTRSSTRLDRSENRYEATDPKSAVINHLGAMGQLGMMLRCKRNAHGLFVPKLVSQKPHSFCAELVCWRAHAALCTVPWTAAVGAWWC